MIPERKPIVPDLFPLPDHIKIRERRFGANPVSPLVSIPKAGDVTASRRALELRWEVRDQGLTVFLSERDNDHLIADVFCSDAGLLNKGAVSVGLIGMVEDDDPQDHSIGGSRAERL